ncbi:hypothetical protein [Polaromonas sp.]|uniref:hypothetical protein n=1 Tax=Polaromonas sp. TaxID=1869339 RepID=UPI00286BD529|nr:hypothetical protein [Polaromonas sp.]
MIESFIRLGRMAGTVTAVPAHWMDGRALAFRILGARLRAGRIDQPWRDTERQSENAGYYHFDSRMRIFRMDQSPV